MSATTKPGTMVTRREAAEKHADELAKVVITMLAESTGGSAVLPETIEQASAALRAYRERGK